MTRREIFIICLIVMFLLLMIVSLLDELNERLSALQIQSQPHTVPAIPSPDETSKAPVIEGEFERK